MKYLITGITGFAGPHLANVLINHGHEVHGLVRHSNGRETDIVDVVSPGDFKAIKFVRADLTNPKALNDVIRKGQYDGVFHLAAQSHPPTSFNDPVGTFSDNVMGSVNLIQAIEDHSKDTKLMFCSTSEVYGNVGIDGHKLTVKDPLLPANPYGASKAAIDLYLQERFLNGKIKGFITRAFSHTGPRRGRTFSISSDAYQIAEFMIAQKLSKASEPKRLRVGNLQTVRVVLDVRDIVNAYYQLMITDKSNGKIYNISGHTPRQMKYYTDTLVFLSDVKDIEYWVDPALYRPIDIQYQWGDTSEVISDTNWVPVYKIDETLDDLLYYWVKKLQ